VLRWYLTSLLDVVLVSDFFVARIILSIEIRKVLIFKLVSSETVYQKRIRIRNRASFLIDQAKVCGKDYRQIYPIDPRLHSNLKMDTAPRS